MSLFPEKLLDLRIGPFELRLVIVEHIGEIEGSAQSQRQLGELTCHSRRFDLAGGRGLDVQVEDDRNPLTLCIIQKGILIRRDVSNRCTQKV